jgi:hypothetical protein
MWQVEKDTYAPLAAWVLLGLSLHGPVRLLLKLQLAVGLLISV